MLADAELEEPEAEGEEAAVDVAEEEASFLATSGPSVAAIALKILPMISPIRLSPPLLTGCVVLAALASPSLLLQLPPPPLSCSFVIAGVVATLFAGVASPRGSCTAGRTWHALLQ